MNEYLQSNAAFWDERTGIHEKSKFYDVDSFMKGKQTLRDIEVKELGDVRGKSLLHLQCHFGMDTLSWARLGANATGADLSGTAIDLAKRLAKELKIPNAHFVQSDVGELPNVLNEKFDIVFTSYGVLCWLQDLGAWAKTIAHFLKEGGTFLIVEEHPLAFILAEKKAPLEMAIGYSYFDNKVIELNDRFSYADDTGSFPIDQVHYEWIHSLEEIMMSLINVGLKIESFHEYPFCMYKKFECLEQRDDSWWYLPEGTDFAVPMLFSLKAQK